MDGMAGERNTRSFRYVLILSQPKRYLDDRQARKADSRPRRQCFCLLTGTDRLRLNFLTGLTQFAQPDVPAPALEAIQKAASNGQVKQVVKGEIRAELRAGQIVKLTSPRYVYEAELVKGNQRAEIEVTPDGQIIEGPDWKKGKRDN